MTFKTKQEVLRAAADWIDVCEKAGVEPICKVDGHIDLIEVLFFNARPHLYEFPLALLEGKEVWVGDELYDGNGKKFKVYEFNDGFLCEKVYKDRGCGRSHPIDICSWNPPKPKTVMIELELGVVEYAARLHPDISPKLTLACKKALEELK